jgi:sarcosine oxidase
MTHYDVIVIGVGGMGSATVYELARRGARVLGLEQFDIPHELGSSHGVSRIIRLAYAEHPNYVPLLRRAYELWREIENRSGERLLVMTGGMDAGAADSAIVRGVLEACAIHHLPHEILDAAAIWRRFPGYRLAPDMVAVYQAESGFLVSERCIVQYVEAAQELGAAVHARERVIDWAAEENGVSVRTERGRYSAKQLVITAGPWASTLVPRLQNVAQPERQVLLWTQPLRPELFRLTNFPIFNLEAPEGRFYGFPIYQVPGFKIGRYHHRGEQVDPDRMNRHCDRDDEEMLRAGIRQYFPDADGPTMGMKTCLFTNSPDEHFILDQHPDFPRITLAAGFSGHGFKFCSVIGEIMAELALEGGTRHDIAMFGLGRFGQ